MNLHLILFNSLRLIFLIGLSFIIIQITLSIFNKQDIELIASDLTIITPNIKLEIKGEINKPGIYYLPKGSRIMELINKAGGVTKNADLKNINLATVLSDGDCIYIPKIGENNYKVIQSKSFSTNNNNNNNNSKTPDIKMNLLNINKATKEELMNLPYIGEKIANDIINYREKNQGFKDINELKNIKGIGEKRLEKLKKLITIK